jgi:hypothetical protein
VFGTQSRVLRCVARALPAFAAASSISLGAEARPNTHAPAISTWDPRASSVVFALGRSVSGEGSFTFTSYNANFSSTNGVLSAQFGVHYTTFKDTEDGPTARGVSAGGVALISLPLSSRFENGVPGSAFAFYIGGVPTAMFSGQLNFISVPLVLGVGLPFSPSEYVTFRPWVELSPGLNFDTRIQAISTDAAIQSAMDGTLTRQEVEALVDEGLNIQQQTTVGKRAGVSIGVHLGERVDFDANLMLGAGHQGALSLGAGLVLRWDRMVHELAPDRRDADRERGSEDADAERESCEALAARYHRTCRLRGAAAPRATPAMTTPSTTTPSTTRPRTAPIRPKASRTRAAPQSSAPRAPVPAPLPRAPASSPQPAAAPGAPAPSGSAAPATKKPPPAAPISPAPPAPRPNPGELPPLQAAPPRTP